MELREKEFQNIIHPKDQNYKKEASIKWLHAKYNIAKEFGGKRFAEIGVRRGYTAYAILAALLPGATFLGVDNQSGAHCGVEGENTFPFVANNLKEKLGMEEKDFVLLKANSRRLNVLPGAPYDFIHIDGDHTTPAVLHDAILAWYSLSDGGTILFDDYISIGQVKSGIGLFVNAFHPLIESHGERVSAHGEYYVRKGKTG